MLTPEERARLVPVGEHECVTCERCACTFARVHPACPRCAAGERARQNEYEGGPCVPDGFTLDMSGPWRIICPLCDWKRDGFGQADLELACAVAREHYASAHPAVSDPNECENL